MLDGLFLPFPCCNKCACRIYGYASDLFNNSPRGRIKTLNGLNTIAPERNPAGNIVVGQVNVHHIPPYTESSSFKIIFVPGIQSVHQSVQQPVEIVSFSCFQGDGVRMEILRIAYSIQTGNAGHDKYVTSAAQQRGRSAQPKFFNFIVNAQVFFYIDIRYRQIRLGLVVIIIRDKILDCIFREKTFELRIKLGRKCFIVAYDQRGPLQLFHDIGHGKCFSRTCHPQ